jgi:hypothetical protein
METTTQAAKERNSGVIMDGIRVGLQVEIVGLGAELL